MTPSEVLVEEEVLVRRIVHVLVMVEMGSEGEPCLLGAALHLPGYAMELNGTTSDGHRRDGRAR